MARPHTAPPAPPPWGAQARAAPRRTRSPGRSPPTAGCPRPLRTAHGPCRGAAAEAAAGFRPVRSSYVHLGDRGGRGHRADLLEHGGDHLVQELVDLFGCAAHVRRRVDLIAACGYL